MRLALFGLLLTALPVSAQKISVVPFAGPKGSSVRSQIVTALCTDPVECVAPTKVAAGNKPNWAKVKKEKVKFIVSGKVTKKGTKQTLDLSLLTKAGPPKLKKSYLLVGGELSEKSVEAAVAAFNKAMGVAASEPDEAPPPEEKKAPPPPDEKPDADQPGEQVADDKPSRRTPTPDPTPPADEKPDDKPDTTDDVVVPDKIKDPIVAIQAGVYLGNRSFSYANVTSPNLRSYSAPFLVAPAFHVEFYPLALALKGMIAGLGLEGGYKFAVGLKSRRSGTDVTYPTSATELNVALRWRIRPIATSNAAVIPFVGFRMQNFSVGAASDGTTLDGLPAIAYSSIMPGVAGEIPFSTSGFSIFGRFAVLIVLSSGEIISQTYFKRGSAFGIDGQLGLGYTIWGPVSVRASFDFTRYGLSFVTDPAMDTYVAEGAADLYIGGTLGVRLTF